MIRTLKYIQFQGIPSGDYEAFCWDVDLVPSNCSVKRFFTKRIKRKKVYLRNGKSSTKTVAS